MSFTVVMEGMTLIAFVVLISGGKQMRESGWKILCGLLLLTGCIQSAAMALVVSFASRFLLLVEGYCGEERGLSLPWICVRRDG